METLKSKSVRYMDALFQTGYPHPINLFAALLATLLPLLSPFAASGGVHAAPSLRAGVAGLLSLLCLVLWSRLRVFQPARSHRFYRYYLFAQTTAVSAIYALDGGLTRFLFVIVAVQAVYISPVRRWAPFIGTLAALWLMLYLIVSPGVSGANRVSTIGMYFCYFVFAALVTFTTVQQERQNEVAQELLDGVDQRYHTLRSYDLTVDQRAEAEERERLAETIHGTLLSRLSGLLVQLARMQRGDQPLTRETARHARLQAKEILAEVRAAVRTLRPGEQGELDDDDNAWFGRSPQPEVAMKWTDPIRVYHIWNVGVIVITTGVIVASLLVARSDSWVPLLGMGLVLVGAYTETAISARPWSRTLCLVVQTAVIMSIVMISREPLMSHLFLIVSAQMVFLVPPVNRWLAATVAFPTILSALALHFTGIYAERPLFLLSMISAFAVTNFFGAVMAFMTRRQVEARDRAVLYAEQVAEVNRLLEARLQEIRRMAIARERVRMARELHDGLGHHLTVVIVELQYVEALADEEPDAAQQHIASAQSITRTAITTSQEMVDSLDRFDRPLPVALADLINTWQMGNGARVRTRVEGDFTGLSTAARITLYRAVQESLTNIQKHARATEVAITLRQMPDRIYLAITNDDVGGAPELVARSGFGLVGLRERADALQGEFSAGHRSDGKFRVKLVLPLGV